MKPSSKSQGDFYVDLYAKLLTDLGRIYPGESSLFHRDLDTIRERVANEGLNFLTVTLPKLGKAVDESLETGVFVAPRDLKRSHVNKAVPAFLQSVLNTAYDSEGNLVGFEPMRLKEVRQICFLLYKLELGYTISQERAVIDSFVGAEWDLASLELPYDERFLHVARGICDDVLKSFDWRDIEPRHGPGAVATGERGEGKWNFSRLYDQIHQTYPYYEFYCSGMSELLHRVQWYKSLSRQDAGTAKVVLVPKDSRGPRLISCEPLEYQWIQQGLGRKLMTHLESHWLTSGRVNFTRQEINQGLALSSSQTQKMATLDLKEASDRLSLALVEWLMPPDVCRALKATRTTGTLLPDGKVLSFHKFAPMGSALCFPVESFVFWAVCAAAIAVETGRNYWDLPDSVYVYGDDIIVATEYFDVVVRALELCGLLVNKGKSFRQGHFRESCGMDAYKGVCVTPVKVKTVWNGKSSDGQVYTSWVAYANEFNARGYHELSSYMFRLVEDLYGKVPYGTPLSAYPCKIESSWMKALIKNIEKGFSTRFVTSTQEVQVRARALRPKIADTTLDSWPRLMRNLVMPSSEDPSLVTHPRSVQLRTGWRRM